MKLSTKMLVGGIVAAPLVYAGGAVNTARLERRESRLERTCEELHLAAKARDAAAAARGEWRSVDDFLKAGMPCQPSSLSEVRDPLDGIEADVISASREARESRTWPATVALVVLLVGAAPWLWYFLLRRVAEMRGALGGSPPDR
jgi:hypothetical protein